jgi:hypothetical protein
MSTAVTIRIHPTWRCICGRTLKAYDVITDTNGVERILCSGCHIELLAVEQRAAEKLFGN